ncbi:hypothetical protein ACLKA6_009587 [Drosophila palustris]
MAKVNNSEEAATPTQDPKLNYLQKLWRYRHYLVVEPFFFFYAAATYLNQIALRNFPLEKACRINLGYSADTCLAMLDKELFNITCPDDLTFENATTGASFEQKMLGITSFGFNDAVCKAEIESQILLADVSGKRAPIAAIFPLIILLFAGGWSDRYNKRKPCMILPIVGEGLSYTGLLISAIFYESLPMEFGSYIEAIVPALFGGITFCLMALYSYITIATPEKDRVFRFGIFAMFVTALPFLNIISGFLYRILGYKLSFASAVVFQIIAILYIIFFIKELKPAKEKPTEVSTGTSPQISSHAADNMAYETTNLDELPVNKNVNFKLTPQLEPPAPAPQPQRRSLLRELFDPTLLMDCIRFPLVKRENNGRMLLILLMLAYFLTTGPAAGEGEYFYTFTLKKLNWNGDKNSVFNAVSGGLALIGTFLGTAILSKLMGFPDSIIGMISALVIVISRFIYAYSENTATFYLATVFDMFATLRVIAIKTIGSSLVAGDELSKMYSIFGISEPIGQFIFPPIYSMIYQTNVESFPGAFFLFGEIFYIPNILVFMLCYFVVRRRKANNNSVELAQNNERNGQTNSGTEITSL